MSLFILASTPSCSQPQEPSTEIVPAINWCVEGVLSAEGIALWVGPPASFKTWLAIDFGISAATATAWLGTFRVPKSRRVLYLNCENPENDAHRILARLLRGRGINKPADAPEMVVVTYPKLPESRHGVEFLLSLADEFDFLIVDSLRAVLPGSENNTEKWSQLFGKRLDP